MQPSHSIKHEAVRLLLLFFKCLFFLTVWKVVCFRHSQIRIKLRQNFSVQKILRTVNLIWIEQNLVIVIKWGVCYKDQRRVSTMMSAFSFAFALRLWKGCASVTKERGHLIWYRFVFCFRLEKVSPWYRVNCNKTFWNQHNNFIQL